MSILSPAPEWLRLRGRHHFYLKLKAGFIGCSIKLVKLLAPVRLNRRCTSRVVDISGRIAIVVVIQFCVSHCFSSPGGYVKDKFYFGIDYVIQNSKAKKALAR